MRYRALPCLCILLAGCSAVTNLNAPSTPDAWEALDVSYSAKIQQWNQSGPEIPPANGIRIPARVVDIDRPCIDSPSIAGDRATVTFEIPSGSLPGSPKCVQVRMRYDNYARPFSRDAEHVLIFLPDGRFWGGGSFAF